MSTWLPCVSHADGGFFIRDTLHSFAPRPLKNRTDLGQLSEELRVDEIQRLNSLCEHRSEG